MKTRLIYVLLPVLLLLVGVFGLLTRPSAATPAAPADTVALQPTIDTWIHTAPGVSDDNYEGDDLFFVGRDEFTYPLFALLHFDLSAIPAGATVTAARLDLYHEAGSSDFLPAEICVHRVTGAWDSTVTGDTVPPYDGACQAAQTVSQTVGIHTWADLTALVEAWRSGAQPNHGLALVQANEGVRAKAFQANEASVPPALVIEYTVGEDGGDMEPQMRFDRSHYTVGDCLLPEMYEPLFNEDANAAEMVPVTVYSRMTADEAEINLIEDDEDSGNFVAEGCVQVASGSAVPDDGALQTAPGDMIAAAASQESIVRLATATVEGGAAEGHFELQVDPSILPASLSSTGSIPGEPDFPLAMVIGPEGLPTLYGEDQVIFATNHMPAVDDFLARRDGRLLNTVEIEYAPGESQQYHLIRLSDVGAHDRSDMAFLMEEYLGVDGAYTYSSDAAANLIGIMLEEQLAGNMVLPHALLQGQGPPDSSENGTLNGYDLPWVNPRVTAFERVGLGQTLAMAEMVDLPELRPGGVTVSVIDSGFAGPSDYSPSMLNPDYGVGSFGSIPQCSINAVGIADCTPFSATGPNPIPCSGTRPCPWHGLNMFSILGAQMDNDFGSLGTGAPVVNPMFMKTDWSYLIPMSTALMRSADGGASVANISSTFPCRPLLLDICNPLEAGIAVGFVSAVIDPICAIIRAMIPGLGDLTCEQIMLILTIPPMAGMLQAATLYAQSRGVAVVAAAGNDVTIDFGITVETFNAPPPNETRNIPCVLPGVLCVGEMGSPDGVATAWFTPTAGGPGVHIYAPAGLGRTPNPGSGGNLTFNTGTSGATAFTSGVVALVRAINPTLTPAQAIALVEEAGCTTSSRSRAGNLGPCTPPIGPFINSSPGGQIDVLNTFFRAWETINPLSDKILDCTGGWDELTQPADSSGQAIRVVFDGSSVPGDVRVSEVAGDLSIHNQTTTDLAETDWYSFTVPVDGSSARITVEEAIVGQLEVVVLDGSLAEVEGPQDVTTPLETGPLSPGIHYVVVRGLDPSDVRDDNCYGGSTLTVELATPPQGDRFEENESVADAAALDPGRWVHGGWDCGFGLGDCTNVFADDSGTSGLLPTVATASWTMSITDLTLHSADDADFFEITLPDYDAEVWGDFGYADIDPDPSIEEPLPECGQVQRQHDWIGSIAPETRGVNLQGRLQVTVEPTANNLSRRPVLASGETLHVYESDGTSVDHLGTRALPTLNQIIHCPQSRENLTNLVVSFGERPDVRSLLDNAGGYTLTLTYEIEAARRMPLDDGRIPGQLPCSAGSIPVPSGGSTPLPAFPYCPSLSLDDVPHPIDPGCIECLPSEFFIIEGPPLNWQFGAQFQAPAEMSFRMYDWDMNLIGVAEPPLLAPVGSNEIVTTTLEVDLAPDQLYFLEVEGPAGSSYDVSANEPPQLNLQHLWLPVLARP